MSLRFINASTVQAITDTVRDFVGINRNMKPTEWQNVLMPYNYDVYGFNQKNVYFSKAINTTANFNGNTSLMMLSGNAFYSAFDTRSTMHNMFNGCTNLFGSPVCSSNVINMSGTYENCKNITGSPVCGPKVTNMHDAYRNCLRITGNPICTDKVVDMYAAFFNCVNLTGSPVCGSNVINMSGTYENCKNITGSPVCGPNVRNMFQAYQNCRILNGRPVCGNLVTDMDNSYQNCKNITGSPICGPNTSILNYAYEKCSRLDNNAYFDAVSTAVFTNTFASAKNKEAEFNLILGANVNVSNINSTTFGVTGEAFTPVSGGPYNVAFNIYTAYPKNGINYTKVVRGDLISTYGLINIYRENNSI